MRPCSGNGLEIGLEFPRNTGYRDRLVDVHTEWVILDARDRKKYLARYGVVREEDKMGGDAGA